MIGNLGSLVCLASPDDWKFGVSSLPKRGFARLGKPLRLGEGGLHLSEPGDYHYSMLWLV